MAQPPSICRVEAAGSPSWTGGVPPREPAIALMAQNRPGRQRLESGVRMPSRDLVAWISREDAVITGPLGVMRCGGSSVVPAPACGSGCRQPLPPRLLTLVSLRAQRVTDDPFPAANIGFHQGTP